MTITYFAGVAAFLLLSLLLALFRFRRLRQLSDWPWRWFRYALVFWAFAELAQGIGEGVDIPLMLLAVLALMAGLGGLLFYRRVLARYLETEP
jgi:hypothetical protein